MLLEKPVLTENREGCYALGRFVPAHTMADAELMEELWQGFTGGQSELEVLPAGEPVFRIGEAECECPDGYEYALAVSPQGACVRGRHEKGMLHGIMTLLQLITRQAGGGLVIPCCYICDRPAIGFRGVHFCIFPETPLSFAEKCIRVCGALKYSAVILEFWGMLRYDAMKELSWSFAYTKDQIRPLVHLANAFGMEVIPMFNHLGHASQSRASSGKHVLLDQNPSLDGLFEEDGWTWNISDGRVSDLLHRVRQELIELCGPGSYFHLGCDEPYSLHACPDHRQQAESIAEFINGVQADLNAQGRRAVIWADMLLSPEDWPAEYSCNAPDEGFAKLLLARLDKQILLADWQYEVKQAPVRTARFLREKGFEVITCPFHSAQNIEACYTTASEEGLPGVLMTTWHTLDQDFPLLLHGGILGWCGKPADIPGHCTDCTGMAALIRKACPSRGDYLRSGWVQHEISRR